MAELILTKAEKDALFPILKARAEGSAEWARANDLSGATAMVTGWEKLMTHLYGAKWKSIEVKQL